MDQEQALEMFRRHGAVIEGEHMILASGLHTDTYISNEVMFSHPTHMMSSLGHSIAMEFYFDDIDVVVGPAKGGMTLGQWVAHHLKTRAAYAEKETVPASMLSRILGGKPITRFALHPYFKQLVKDKRVLVVDDTITTGRSVRMVIEAVREAGGDVVGAAVVWNRGEITWRDLAVVKFHAVINKKIEAWQGKI